MREVILQTWGCDTCQYRQDFQGSTCPNDGKGMVRFTNPKRRIRATIADNVDIEAYTVSVNSETTRNLTASEIAALKSQRDASEATLSSRLDG